MVEVPIWVFAPLVGYVVSDLVTKAVLVWRACRHRRASLR